MFWRLALCALLVFEGHGKPTDGKPMDGKPMDGKPMDGKPMDGKPTDEAGKSFNDPIFLLLIKIVAENKSPATAAPPAGRFGVVMKAAGSGRGDDSFDDAVISKSTT